MSTACLKNGRRIDKLLCLGSPLGVFLQMRQIPASAVIPQHVTRMFNMFHPVDVVAYRLEPLLSPHYALVKPAKLFWAEAIRKAMANPDYDTLTPEMYSHKSVGEVGTCISLSGADTTSSSCRARATTPARPCRAAWPSWRAGRMRTWPRLMRAPPAVGRR